MAMTMADRWAADEELDGRYANVDDTEPRWTADGLEDSYGPDAPDQPSVRPEDIDPDKR